MEFKNARRGVGLLFTSVILEFFAGILTSCTLYLTASSEEGRQYLVVFALVIVAAMLSILSFIWNLRGLFAASRDHLWFRNALVITILIIAAQVINLVFTATKIQFAYMSLILGVLTAFISICICCGIGNLYRQKGETRRASGAVRTACIFVLATILSDTPEFLVALGTIPLERNILLIVGILSGILNIVGYFSYLICLNHARKEL